MENNYNNIPVEKFQFAKKNDLFHDSKFETKPVSYFQGAFQRFSKNKGAVVGGVLNLLGAVRAVVFLFKDKLKADRLPWLLAFTASYVTVYVLNFTAFGKEPTVFNLTVELLPVIGMLALNIGFMLKDAAAVRKCGLVSSPSWLIYNLVVGSWGAIICEVLTLISIFIGMARHDQKA
jgi:hypothetical protein